MTSKTKDNLIISFVFLSIFLISVFILHNNVYCVDDLAFNFLDEPFDLNRELCYGAWVMKLQYFLMYALPFKYEIDLNTWGMFFGSVFKSFVLVLFPFIFYKLFVFKGISKIGASFLSFLFYLLFFAFQSKTTYVDLTLFSGFFRFYIPAVCMCFTLYLVYKYFNGEKVNSIFFLILGFICAFSSEVVAGILLTFSGLMLIYQFVNTVSDKSKKLLPEMLPYSSLFIGLVLGALKLLSTPGFQHNFTVKMNYSSLLISNIVSSFTDFYALMFKTIFLDYWYVWLILTLVFIFNYRNSETKQNFFVSFIFAGILIFDFSLIILGKTHYSGNYWLIHNDIHAIYISAMMFSFALLLPPLVLKYSKTAIFKIILIILSVFALSIFTYFAHKLYDKLYNVKDFAYLRDKMVIFYALKKQQPILPISVHIFNPIFGKICNLNNKDISVLYLGFLEAPPGELYCGYEQMAKYYYFLSYRVYIPEESLKLEYMPHYDAMDIYSENGGVYDEVLNRTYKFSNLKDKDFVLNLKEL